MRCGSRDTGVYFPFANGTTVAASVPGRTIAVRGILAHPNAAPNLSACAAAAGCPANQISCSDFAPGGCTGASLTRAVDRAHDMTIIYLAADAPADIQPMQVLVDASVQAASSSFATFPGITKWAKANKPYVTIAGSGAGTNQYGGFVGRDSAITRWTGTTYTFVNPVWTGCTTNSAGTKQSALVLTAPDLAFPWPGNPGVPRAGAGIPAGFSIAGANYGAAEGGDSGGPVVVGDDGVRPAPWRGGTLPTSLPVPGTGDTYLANTRYVAGIAEWNITSGGLAGDVYAATYDLSNSTFLAQALSDLDGDGLPDGADPFPLCNPLFDSDGDGTCDDKDLCPCDANEQDPSVDDDGDGICGACDGTLSPTCATRCANESPDNCLGVANSGQENCNYEAEVRNGRPILGDACDGVPCADSSPEAERLSVSFGNAACSSPLPIVNAACPVTVDSAIRWRGVLNQAGTTGIVQFAHCDCDQPHATPGERLANCATLGVLPRCTLGSFRSFPTSTGSASDGSVWHSITTTYSGGGTSFGPLPAERNHRYSTAFGVAGTDTTVRSWRFDRDLQLFLGSSYTPPSGVGTVSALLPVTNALRGVGWGYTPQYFIFDLTQAALPGSPSLRYADLASHYFKQDLGAKGTITLSPNVYYLPPKLVRWPWPDPGPLSVSTEVAGHVGPWLSISGARVLAVTNNLATDVTDELDTGLLPLVRGIGTTYTMVAASEPQTVLASRKASLRGIFLDAMTQFPIGGVFEGPDGIPTNTPLGSCGVECDVLSHRSVRALSGLRAEHYIVGREGDEERFTRMDLFTGAITDVPVTGINQQGEELAIAYRYQDDSVYLLDRVGTGLLRSLRLLRLDRGGSALELARVPYLGLHDVFHLGVNPEGQLVITSVLRAALGGSTSIVLLEPGDAGVRFVGWLTRPGRVVLPPDTRNRFAYPVATDVGGGLVALAEVPRSEFRALPGLWCHDLPTLIQ